MTATPVEPMAPDVLPPEVLARLERDLLSLREEYASRVRAASTAGEASDLTDPDSVTERHATGAIVRQAADVLDAVQRALKRIEDGSYGICVSCGRSILHERLEVIPHAETCVTCSVAPRSIVA